VLKAVFLGAVGIFVSDDVLFRWTGNLPVGLTGA